MLSEEVLLRCKLSDFMLANKLAGVKKDFADMHTTHVGSFANSPKSSVASVVSDPVVWAEIVRAESSIAAMVARCMMKSGHRLLYRAGRLRLQDDTLW